MKVLTEKSSWPRAAERLSATLTRLSREALRQATPAAYAAFARRAERACRAAAEVAEAEAREIEGSER